MACFLNRIFFLLLNYSFLFLEVVILQYLAVLKYAPYYFVVGACHFLGSHSIYNPMRIKSNPEDLQYGFHDDNTKLL